MSDKKDTDLEKQSKDSDSQDSTLPADRSNAEHQASYAYPSGYGYGYGYGYGQSSSTDRTLKDYPLILLRYWPLILCLTLVGMGIAVYKTKRTPRIYQSASLVDIGVYVAVTDGPTSTQLEEDTRRANYINTQTSLLKSLSIAQIVLSEYPTVLEYVKQGQPAKFNVDTIDKSEKTQQELPVGLLQSYIGAISFQKLDGTSLVRISARTRNPDMSAEFANAHAASFIKLVQDRRERDAAQNEEFLSKQLERATRNVETLERARIEHAKLNSLIASGSSILEKTYASKFQGLADSLNVAIEKRVELESRYRQLRKRGGVAVFDSDEDSKLNDRRIALKQLEAEYITVSRHIKDRRHPQLVSLRDRINAERSIIREVGKQRLRDSRDNYYASAERERYLKNEFSKLKSEEIETSKHKVQHDLLKQKVDSAKTAQQSITKRLDEVKLNIQNNQQTVFLIDRAFPSSYHISPNEVANLWNGCLLGALFGVLLAILLDFLDNTIRSVNDLQQTMQIPVLGVVPEFSKQLLVRTQELDPDSIDLEKSVETNEESSAIIEQIEQHSDQTDLSLISRDTPIPLHFAPFSRESEAFRSILVALTSGDKSDYCNKILITSGQKGDGKTTLAINLAIALAQLGEKTLLIDGDLRVPSLHEYFKSPRGTAGLVDCVEDKVPETEAVLDVGITNLDILLSGRVVDNPARLLRSNKLALFLDKLGESYNYIIIDSAPVAPVADALLLSRHVDGVAVVVRSGETPQSIAESTVARLKQVGANLLGVVLNDASRNNLTWKMRGNYSYQDKYSYDYTTS